MALNKKERDKFEQQLRKRMLLFPRDVHKEQFSLFEEDEPSKYAHLEFMLHYPDLSERTRIPITTRYQNNPCVHVLDT